jgi:hypothetical protein
MRYVMCKRVQSLTLLLGLIMVLSVCGNVKGQEARINDAHINDVTPLALLAAQSSVSEAGTYYVNSTLASIDTGGFTVAYEFTADDTGGNINRANATTIAFNGNSARISGPGADFAGKTLTIRQAGTYVLSGTLADGQVLINAGRNDVVNLVLIGVSLHNENGPAIYAPRSGKVVLFLESGVTNTVSDGAAYAASGDDDPNAAIFVQDSLSIAGGGTLSVTGSYRHGIRAQDILAVTGGVINVNASGDAIRGRDGVAIMNGSFTLTAGGDGIQSNNSNSDAMGYVLIHGGAFDIKAKNDGIQAESSLTITGGVFRITSGGGSAAAPARANNFRGWGGRQAPVTTASTESMKALKAARQIYIVGGDFTIDAEDDGVHSNGSVLITAGRLSIRTGDDGIHADNAVEITGGDISIPASYEGIEGTSVTIAGGNISVTASDDGINAANGDDSAAPFGRPMGRGRIDENLFVRITGGTIDILAGHDGIDSNGNLFLEGGALKVSGPSQGMEGAIDFDGSFIITGGELITAGSVININESTQPVILVAYTRQLASGSAMAIRDSAGNTILEYTSRNACTISGFTSPAFEVGKTYTLYINGQKRVDIPINNTLMAIGDDGRVYSSGLGGRGGVGGIGGILPGGRMPGRW